MWWYRIMRGRSSTPTSRHRPCPRPRRTSKWVMAFTAAASADTKSPIYCAQSNKGGGGGAIAQACLNTRRQGTTRRPWQLHRNTSGCMGMRKGRMWRRCLLFVFQANALVPCARQRCPKHATQAQALGRLVVEGRCSTEKRADRETRLGWRRGRPADD